MITLHILIVHVNYACHISFARNNMVLSTYEKQRILYYHRDRLLPSQILSALKVEGIVTTRQTIARFIKRFIATASIARKQGSGRPSKITERVIELVEKRMREDDETTAVQLHVLLTACDISISLSTIVRSRSQLGWTFRGSKYCQLIRTVNKSKRFQWVYLNYLEHLNNGFENVIWSDETTVQLESHRRHSYRKKGEQATLKPHPKHPIKLHVWAGISKRGPTPVVIFKGTMNADLYVEILQRGLLPFIRRKYPDSHRFMQDNDPKHTSRTAKAFFENENINWWKTPPESPDLNPIENLWHELKEYIRREVKPTRESELTAGITRFWDTVDANKCKKYIGHLKKVFPRVIDVSGAATGY